MTQVATRSKSPENDPRLMNLIKSTYTAQQQVRYLYLQAEIDSLLLQQQALRAKRQAQHPPKP